MTATPKIAYIMRGVPGSGKSTVAKILAGPHGIIHSTDSYFIENGEYLFKPHLLKRNHELNFEAFSQSLSKGIPIIICDNTNVRKIHFMPYIEEAQKNCYIVAVVSMPHPEIEVAATRNIHGVTASVIHRMIEQWENY